jgi:hypothetical protein
VNGTWKSGAEWTPGGAACIDTFRYNPNNQTSGYVSAHCPERKTGGFACFGSGSSFFTSTGFATPLAERSLVREEFDQQYVRSSYY